jgi:hypothetical protein
LGNVLSIIGVGIVVWAVFMFLGEPWSTPHATLIVQPLGKMTTAERLPLPDRMEVSSIAKRPEH